MSAISQDESDKHFASTSRLPSSFPFEVKDFPTMTSTYETDPSFDAENPSFDNPEVRKAMGQDDPGMKAFAAYQDGEQPAEELVARSYAEDASYKSMTDKTFDDDVSKAQSKELESPASPSLQAINIANIICYIANVSIVFIIGSTNISDIPTNAEISAKYPTLLTPSGYAFSIWGVVFLAQLIWAVAQLLPAYRACDLVINGVGWNYVWICIAQIAWTGFFAQEYILNSMIAMIFILIPLMIVLFRFRNHMTNDNQSYFLLKLPFETHAAWIMAASLVNFSILLVDMGWFSKNFQVVVAVLSILLLAGAGFFFTMQEQYAVPCVIGWATLAIAIKLSDPYNISMVERFPSAAISGLEFAAGGLAAFLWLFVLTKIYILDAREASSNQETLLNDASPAEEDDYVKL
ncbi:unnamed protein product [Cylindrotheca closterium]|uniref:Uncharacterized protein n=1 Tax=Cylindrotheca closterium TaxID=2856 RepID=A0AAD2FS49_9STRA|nr:unnamed protein product [Cylindrotheca closterium]